MAVFPITYVELIIWIILLVIQVENVNKLFLFRIFGIVFGFVAGADCLAGERWLFIDASGNFTLKQFDDGLTPLLSGVMIFGSGMVFIWNYIEYSAFRKSKREDSGI